MEDDASGAERGGYTVLEAADGQTALRLAAEHEPAMVLLDCKLPDMASRDACRERHGHQDGRRKVREVLDAQRNGNADRLAV
jgi:DNA-binding response OmpR family regulator